jgi:hypothetical protein
MSSNTDDERERGILSTADRDYLREPDKFSRQSSYQRRDAIRQRLKDGFVDFRLLFHRLDDETINDVFSDVSRETAEEGIHTTTTPHAKLVMPAVVGFLGRISSLTDAKVNPEIDAEAFLQPLASTTERGIEQLLGEQHGLTADIAVSVSVENVRQTADLAADLRERDEIPPKERLRKAAKLSRGGYSDDEIVDILGD